MGQPITIDDRLNRLERENRRLKLAGMAMFVGVLGIFGAGAAMAPIHDEILTRRLVILGPNNDPRVILFVNQDGGAGVTVTRANNAGEAARIGSNPAQGGSGEVITVNSNGVQTFHTP